MKKLAISLIGIASLATTVVSHAYNSQCVSYMLSMESHTHNATQELGGLIMTPEKITTFGGRAAITRCSNEVDSALDDLSRAERANCQSEYDLVSHRSELQKIKSNLNDISQLLQL